MGICECEKFAYNVYVVVLCRRFNVLYACVSIRCKSENIFEV